jgi:signal transduction histidine kinase
MVFCVSDEGAGIPPEHAGMLLDPTFSTKEFSSGLGISFANEVAELHGGRLSFESRQGEGARFCLHLPIHAGPDAAPQD